MRPEAGQGSGWEQLARQVADVVPPEEVDALWVFPVRRQDQREFGTAVLTRLAGEEGDRRRIYTARFMLQVKGKERGRFEADVAEVGSGPLSELPELLHEVHLRADDEYPPVPIDPAEWLPAVEHDAAQS
ncbi:MAG TPA: hypothetical protein VFS94_08820 [Gemmatimonadales bacterium]|nr:hypothetical protein [Gemmatimonadales bacterium]